MIKYFSKQELLERLSKDVMSDEISHPSSDGIPDVWIAKSLLQKAIRRADSEHALRAAMFLVEKDNRSFWRRLPVVAWEDIGLGDINLCSLTDTVAGSKRLRSKLGEEWRVAACLVKQLCAAPKDRTTDDLLTVIEHDQKLGYIRERLAFSTPNERKDMLSDSIVPLEQRAIALHYALGTDKFESNFLKHNPADSDPETVMNSIGAASQELVAICLGGLKRTRTILPAYAMLLWPYWVDDSAGPKFRTDDFGHYYTINSIPRYAYDGNTRSGRKYLHWLAQTDIDLADYLQQISPKSIHRPLVRKLYFRLKSSLCTNRQNWESSNRLRQRADEIGFGLHEEAIELGKKTLAIAMMRYPMSEEHL